ncbi:MAG: DegT/DnrJ/EryC1/StrS family aminotransferase [Calditrichia bacterium]
MTVKREKFLPFALPSIGEEEIREVVDSLRSGWVTTGPKVKQFEGDICEYVQAKNAIAVNSCTAGLHLALSALGVGPGDEVVLPTLTFTATANVVVHLGAKPVLLDVGNDFNVQPEFIENAITEKTRAIVPVHHSGQSVNLKEIYEIAARHNIPIVEDAAHAIGTTYHDHKIGSDYLNFFGQDSNLKRAAVFSFYATKNMTTGEGGMITTNDDEYATTMRILSLHGMSKDAWKRYTSAGSWYYEVVAAGYKYNMTDIQASLGIHQLKKLDGFIQRRQEIAAAFDNAFREMPEIEIPFRHNDRNHVFHLYMIRLNPDRLSIDRSQFIEALKERHIGTSVHFIPVHLHPFYKKTYGYQQGDLPNAEKIYERIISLPLYPAMNDGDVKDVITAVEYVIQHNRR